MIEVVSTNTHRFREFEKDYLFDKKVLNELRSIDEDNNVHLLMCDYFRQSAPRSLGEIEAYLSVAQFQKARHLSHSLRSTCQNIGAHALSDQLLKIERDIVEGTLGYDNYKSYTHDLPLLLALTLKEVDLYAS